MESSKKLIKEIQTPDNIIFAVEKGNVKSLKGMNLGLENLLKENNKGVNPLGLAQHNKNQKVLDYFYDVGKGTMNDLFSWAISCHQSDRVLESLSQDINEITLTHLTSAVMSGNLNALQFLLEKKGGLKDNEGASLLVDAAAKNQFHIIQFLLNEKIDINSKYEDRSPLLVAFQMGSIECIEFLMRKNAKDEKVPEKELKNDKSLLALASCIEDPETIGLFMKNNFKPEETVQSLLKERKYEAIVFALENGFFGGIKMDVFMPYKEEILKNFKNQLDSDNNYDNKMERLNNVIDKKNELGKLFATPKSLKRFSFTFRYGSDGEKVTKSTSILLKLRENYKKNDEILLASKHK